MQNLTKKEIMIHLDPSYHACSHCGVRARESGEQNNVIWRVNPFALEVMGNTISEWLCDDCHRGLADDI